MIHSLSFYLFLVVAHTHTHLGTAQDNITAIYNDLKTDFSQKMFQLAQARDVREVNDMIL